MVSFPSDFGSEFKKEWSKDNEIMYKIPDSTENILVVLWDNHEVDYKSEYSDPKWAIMGYRKTSARTDKEMKKKVRDRLEDKQ